ncbi:hypothetical protein [Chitinophaga sancti]|uniref:Uncharacterized protein n=1 Tax=Chitinophaga sancti TaxID=1004 RepID=A0A1K1T444_9BACT|nr:hypothetical protein [Chitinophaga sancti]WQD59544.1 hypothetical protein U0033_16750 [Chitinophaga sancti]WQG88322.1 hypothetical protein SR876_25715 [Chitinophaga sancti]SFW91119.1 hypothetical protein SAMN05661012_06730 [Chitinophaga sancti]
MKKVNIILSLIALISFIGGALAFKTQHRFNGALRCYTTVGTMIGGITVFAAIPPSVRYSPTNPTGTLFCSIPGPNVTYKPVKVSLAQ